MHTNSWTDRNYSNVIGNCNNGPATCIPFSLTLCSTELRWRPHGSLMSGALCSRERLRTSTPACPRGFLRFHFQQLTWRDHCREDNARKTLRHCYSIVWYNGGYIGTSDWDYPSWCWHFCVCSTYINYHNLSNFKTIIPPGIFLHHYCTVLLSANKGWIASSGCV